MAKLPKTSSGLPAFSSSDHVTWPFFKRMMFMKDEFIGRKMTSRLNCREIGATELPKVELHVEENCSQLYEPNEFYAGQSASSSALRTTSPHVETSSPVSNQSWDSSECRPSAKKLKRHRLTSSQSEYEEKKLAMLERVVTTDELDVFASDIANDLRKIKCHPLNFYRRNQRFGASLRFLQ